MRADVLVERRCGRDQRRSRQDDTAVTAQQKPVDERQPRARGTADKGGQRTHDPHRDPRGPNRVGCQRRSAARQQLHRAGLGLRTPRVWLADVAGLRRSVHQCGEQVVSRHPVDGRVVHLDVDGLPATLQTVDEIGLPQRTAAVQRPRMQPCRLHCQLAIITRRGQRQLADMELDVEIGVLDPVRLIQPKGHLHQAAAKQRDQMQPGLDELGQPLKRQRLAARGRIEDGHAAHVPVCRRRVERQKCGI